STYYAADAASRHIVCAHPFRVNRRRCRPLVGKGWRRQGRPALRSKLSHFAKGRNMRAKSFIRISCGALLAGLAACGGSGCGADVSTPMPQSGNVPLVVSDATADDWATIGVRILSISLVPQGGGAAVQVYTAPSAAPLVNLQQLDQLGEILGNVSVPVG